MLIYCNIKFLSTLWDYSRLYTIVKLGWESVPNIKSTIQYVDYFEMREGGQIFRFHPKWLKRVLILLMYGWYIGNICYIYMWYGWYCQTWLHLGCSSKLKIWQVPACKIEPQIWTISWKNTPPTQPPTHPTTNPPNRTTRAFGARRFRVITGPRREKNGSSCGRVRSQKGPKQKLCIPKKQSISPRSSRDWRGKLAALAFH